MPAKLKLTYFEMEGRAEQMYVAGVPAALADRDMAHRIFFVLRQLLKSQSHVVSPPSSFPTKAASL